MRILLISFWYRGGLIADVDKYRIGAGSAIVKTDGDGIKDLFGAIEATLDAFKDQIEIYEIKVIPGVDNLILNNQSEKNDTD